ncbi:diaminopimelate epimerase [Candidatus Vidania fulgoroideorum]
MKFLKMHSYGNNFLILIDFFNNFKKKKINLINDINFGICFDQIIILKKYKNKKFFLKIFNKDSSLAYNCVNGIRCFFKYISKKININKINFIVENKKFKLKKKKKNILSFSNENNSILKYFKFKHKKMFLRNLKKNFQIFFNGYYNLINLGNNHVIKFVKKIKIKKILKEKKKFNNYNFTHFNYKKKKILTFEKGAGFTKSCGSATLSSCFLYSKIKNKKIRIKTQCGSIIYFNKKNCLKGKSFFIYKGYLRL